MERYAYDVFGEPNRASDVNNPYLFTGRRYDDETDRNKRGLNALIVLDFSY